MTKSAAFIKVRCKPGKRDEVRKLYEEHIKPHVMGEKAAEFVCYCYDTQDEDVVYIFEFLSDPSMFKKVTESDWFKAYQQEVQPLLAAPPEMALTTPVFAKGASL